MNRREVLAACALGLALRLAYSWVGYRGHYVPTSSDGYETIALSLLDRGEYALEPGHPTSLREPSYPLFIAAVYSVFGRRPWVVIVLQVFLSVLTGVLLWLTARRLFDERVAFASLLVFMLHPQSVYYCAYFFRETWLCFLFGLLLWLSTRWSLPAGDPRGARAAFFGGLAAAAFGLANSAVLPACGLAGLLIWPSAPRGTRARRGLLYFAPLVLLFGLWTARNYAVQGRFVPGSTHGGEEFLQALIVPPEDLGTARHVEIVAHDPAFAAVAKMAEGPRDRYLTRAAFRWIAVHPRLFASRALAGVVKYWRPWPYRRHYQHSYAILFLASLLSDAWIIPLGFAGIWLFGARWREAPAFAAALPVMTLVYGCVHAVLRYRLPLMGGMILLACAAASELSGRIGRIRSQDHV